MKKMFIAGLLALALPLAASASTITGTLSSSGVVTTTSSSTLTGTVSTSSTGSLSGTVGGGSGSLTGTVVSPSSSSGGGGGGGGGGGTNGPPAGGGGGGGGGGGPVIICPNLPNSLYALPAGYDVVNGNCDPVGQVLGASTGPTTGPSTPGVPNTGEGGFAFLNLMELLFSGALAAGGYGLLRRT